MQAVILAGGLGTRMRPLTYTRPKTLLPILNMPMIQHVVDQLPAEVDEVILALSYHRDQLEEYFESQRLDVRVTVVEEEEPLGTGGAIKNVEGYLNGPFLVLNGDVISTIDLTAFISFHRMREGVASIAVYPVKEPSPFGVVDANSDGKIRRFQEKPAPGTAFSNLINAGIYYLEPPVLDYLVPDRITSLEAEIFPRLIPEGFHAYTFEGHWIDAGTPGNFLKAHKMLMDERHIQIQTTEAEIDESALLKPPTVLGPYTIIEAEAQVGPYVCCGGRVTIEKGAVVSNSVLFDGSILGEESNVTGSILGVGCQIGTSASVASGSILGDGTLVDAGVRLSSGAADNGPAAEI